MQYEYESPRTNQPCGISVSAESLNAPINPKLNQRLNDVWSTPGWTYNGIPQQVLPRRPPAPHHSPSRSRGKGGLGRCRTSTNEAWWIGELTDLMRLSQVEVETDLYRSVWKKRRHPSISDLHITLHRLASMVGQCWVLLGCEFHANL